MESGKRDASKATVRAVLLRAPSGVLGCPIVGKKKQFRLTHKLTSHPKPRQLECVLHLSCPRIKKLGKFLKIIKQYEYFFNYLANYMARALTLFSKVDTNFINTFSSFCNFVLYEGGYMQVW